MSQSDRSATQSKRFLPLTTHGRPRTPSLRSTKSQEFGQWSAESSPVLKNAPPLPQISSKIASVEEGSVQSSRKFVRPEPLRGTVAPRSGQSSSVASPVSLASIVTDLNSPAYASTRATSVTSRSPISPDDAKSLLSYRFAPSSTFSSPVTSSSPSTAPDYYTGVNNSAQRTSRTHAALPQQATAEEKHATRAHDIVPQAAIPRKGSIPYQYAYHERSIHDHARPTWRSKEIHRNQTWSPSFPTKQDDSKERDDSAIRSPVFTRLTQKLKADFKGYFKRSAEYKTESKTEDEACDTLEPHRSYHKIEVVHWSEA